MAKYVALGSNMGPRRELLNQAVTQIANLCEVVKVSPLYETAPLPRPIEISTSLQSLDHQKFFLNMVIEIDTPLNPAEFLKAMQKIEQSLGRKPQPRWSPRPIDIDIIHWDDQTVSQRSLSIPHPHWQERAFVLDPLKDLSNEYIDLARSHRKHQPLIMGIVNLTPDSFSQGPQPLNPENFPLLLEQWVQENVQIIDLGAESTRPGATAINSELEWQRLKPFLIQLKEMFGTNKLPPLLSLDSRHPETIQMALDYDLKIINDVSGLCDEKMINILKECDADYVLTHSLRIPADPKHQLKEEPIAVLSRWLEEKLEVLQSHHIDLSRVIFDPGIGFGKSAAHSLTLLKNIEKFHHYPVRLMVGHSRKSFLNRITEKPFKDRDLETLGVSAALHEKSVDILRVHDPVSHQRFLRGKNFVTR